LHILSVFLASQQELKSSFMASPHSLDITDRLSISKGEKEVSFHTEFFYIGSLLCTF